MRGCEVRLVQLVDAIEVDLEHIIDRNGPKLLITERLPRLWLEIRLNVVTDYGLNCLKEGVLHFVLDILEVGKSDDVLK